MQRLFDSDATDRRALDGAIQLGVYDVLSIFIRIPPSCGEIATRPDTQWTSLPVT
jgi:hypothetical protein